MDNRVAAIRRSNTTVRPARGPLVAPEQRDRPGRPRPWSPRSGSRPPNPRPTLNPPPVWLASPSPAMTPTDMYPEVLPVRRPDPGGRDQGHLHRAVAVVGRVDLTDPGVCPPRLASSARASSTLASVGTEASRSSHRSTGTAATPSGTASRTCSSGGGERGVVPGLGQGLLEDRRVEGPGPGEARAGGRRPPGCRCRPTSPTSGTRPRRRRPGSPSRHPGPRRPRCPRRSGPSRPPGRRWPPAPRGHRPLRSRGSSGRRCSLRRPPDGHAGQPHGGLTASDRHALSVLAAGARGHGEVGGHRVDPLAGSPARCRSGWRRATAR